MDTQRHTPVPLSQCISDAKPLGQFIRRVIRVMVNSRTDRADVVEVEAKVDRLTDKVSGQRLPLRVHVGTRESLHFSFESCRG
ncbi:hypothetical protein BKA93DRAFT_105360 [Sparassis latifolia]